MTTNTNAALAEAERLLRRDAESLREGHTSHRDRDDWAGEDDAKAGYDEYIRAADALAALTTAAAVPPEGWVMVPVEPTEEMIIAGVDASLRVADAWLGGDDTKNPHVARWFAMLASAPKAELAPTGHFPDAGKMVAQPAGEYPPLPEPYHVAYDYSAELLLQHAMLLLDKPAAVGDDGEGNDADR